MKKLCSVCLHCRFIERKLLSNYSPGLICDIVGVVMFVSRDIRERKTNKSSFWLSKWVHLNDGKETHVVPLFTVSLEYTLQNTLNCL